MRFLEVSIPHLSAQGTLIGALQMFEDFQMLHDIDVVYLLPVFQPSLQTSASPYCITHFKALNPSIGNFNDFKLFVDYIHFKGKKVILDIVLNHTSSIHPWKDRHNFYVCDEDGKPVKPINTEWNDVIQLNHSNPEVEKELFDILDFWLNKNVDGFRFDATSFIPIEFWNKLLPKLDGKICWADTNSETYRSCPFTHFTTRLSLNETLHDRSVVFSTNHDLLLSQGSLFNQFGEKTHAHISSMKQQGNHYMAIPFENSNIHFSYSFLLTVVPT